MDDDACPGPGAGTDVDPYCSIQTAIDMAANGDEILVAPGAYNETINFNGKAVALRSSGGRDVTTIDATGLNDTVVRCVNGEGPDTLLEGFTITGGLGFNGGGIRILNSSPTISQCNLINNVAENIGGGLLCNGGDPSITHCNFISNTAQAGGGILTNLSSASIQSCTFIRNSATGSLGNGGGGIFPSSGQPIIFDSLFIANSAVSNGGAVEIDSIPDTIFFINCVFVANTSEGDGEAFYIDPMPGIGPTLINCILWDHDGQPIFSEGTTWVSHSDIQFGWSGVGNINVDPMFVRNPSPGPDDEWGTSDDDFGDLHLQETSPCINTGDRSAPHLPTLDLGGQQRIQGCFIDMGVYEFLKPDPIVDADTDCDNDVDGVDFVKFAECFNKAGNPPRTLGCSDWAGDQLDFDNDGDVDGVDFAQFAQCFNKAGNPP